MSKSNPLKEALERIAEVCDNQNETHESIWRIATQALSNYKEQGGDVVQERIQMGNMLSQLKEQNYREFVRGNPPIEYPTTIQSLSQEDRSTLSQNHIPPPRDGEMRHGVIIPSNATDVQQDLIDKEGVEGASKLMFGGAIDKPTEEVSFEDKVLKEAAQIFEQGGFNEIPTEEVKPCSCSQGRGLDHDGHGKQYCIDCGNYTQEPSPSVEEKAEKEVKPWLDCFGEDFAKGHQSALDSIEEWVKAEVESIKGLENPMDIDYPHEKGKLAAHVDLLTYIQSLKTK